MALIFDCNKNDYNTSAAGNQRPATGNQHLIITLEVHIMKNFSKVSVAQDARTELHDKLSLTGAEVSVNNFPAGACVPFVHSHKNNEEIYVVLAGKGKAVIDGETVELAAGDWVKIAPAAKRQFFAADDSAISFACIQVKADSLEGYTADDAVIEE